MTNDLIEMSVEITDLLIDFSASQMGANKNLRVFISDKKGKQALERAHSKILKLYSAINKVRARLKSKYGGDE